MYSLPPKFHPLPPNNNFHATIQNKLHFLAAVIAAVSFFLTSGFLYLYVMLDLIIVNDQYLLNVILAPENGQLVFLTEGGI